jgi:glycosyltransferase involved in cell wall biosynthesis
VPADALNGVQKPAAGRFARPAAPAVERPPVSIVVPAYSEEERLARTLPRMLSDPNWPADCELIVVDDGSPDGTAKVAEARLAGVPGARVLRLPWHAGKGAAVRLGVAAARGRKVVFMDADLATDLGSLPELLETLDHAEVVVGSRRLRGSIVTGRSPARGLLHNLFSRQARKLAGIGATDPQCGFKGFTHDAAEVLFHFSRTDGFGFDVEVLLLANRLGLRVMELPVRWHAIEGSKVHVLRDPALMLLEVVRARARHLDKPATSLGIL